MGRRRMRYPASEKLEIIRLVENSHLSARRKLQKLGIPRSTFNRWYDRFLAGASMRWRIAGPGRTGSGTAFLRKGATRSSNWL